MGLFSKKKPKPQPDDPLQPSSSQYQAPEEQGTSSPTAEAAAYSESNAKAKAPETHPTPSSGGGSGSAWPIVPHTAEYEAKVAAVEDAEKAAKATGNGQRKSWLARKLNLVGPEEKEYYDRKDNDGKGSEYDQASQAALRGTLGVGRFS